MLFMSSLLLGMYYLNISTIKTIFCFIMVIILVKIVITRGDIINNIVIIIKKIICNFLLYINKLSEYLFKYPPIE